MKSQRMFQMLNLIINKKQITAPELAEIFNVSVRTIYRDIETLSLSGIPIYTSSGKNGGIKILENYKIDRMVFTKDEQDMLLQAVQNVQLPSDKADNLGMKLSTLFNNKKEQWLTVDFTRWGTKAEDDNSKFDLLKQAILERVVLQIEYCSEASHIQERKLCPVQLIYKSTNWYLYALCLYRQDYRLFKLNRIIKMTECEETFDERIICSWKENSDMKEADNIHLCLKFDKKMGFRVYDEFSFDSVKQDENGDFIVTADIPDGEWICGYLLSFGSKVKILKPEYMRNKVMETARRILEDE